MGCLDSVASFAPAPVARATWDRAVLAQQTNFVVPPLLRLEAAIQLVNLVRKTEVFVRAADEHVKVAGAAAPSQRILKMPPLARTSRATAIALVWVGNHFQDE